MTRRHSLAGMATKGNSLDCSQLLSADPENPQKDPSLEGRGDRFQAQKSPAWGASVHALQGGGSTRTCLPPRPPPHFH